MPLITLTTIDDLHAALARATTTPQFLFKHSETCGMSWQAHEEVSAVLDDPAWEADIHLVSVQASRVVSNEIARRLQVRHASPQLLLVTDGVVRWQATHLAITAAAIRKAAGGCGLGARG